MTSETTPEGIVSYTYDTASRRATMQVAGQSQVGYTFDNANRLTQIAQGTSTVGFSYDNANRRSTLTLPNGATLTFNGTHEAFTDMVGMLALSNESVPFTAAYRPKYNWLDNLAPGTGGIGQP